MNISGGTPSLVPRDEVQERLQPHDTRWGGEWADQKEGHSGYKMPPVVFTISCAPTPAIRRISDYSTP